MRAPAELARNAVRRIVDFALPPRCTGCDTVTADTHSFCLDCWSALAFLGEPCCAACGFPFDFDGGEGALCGGMKEPLHFDRLRAAVPYGDISRRVALHLKYSGRPGIAVTMARFMAPSQYV